jgi:RHS repeat-associated protein
VCLVPPLREHREDAPVPPAPEAGGRYGHSAQEYDADTTWHCHRTRFCDSSIGRWLSEDPIDFVAVDSNFVRYLAH